MVGASRIKLRCCVISSKRWRKWRRRDRESPYYKITLIRGPDWAISKDEEQAEIGTTGTSSQIQDKEEECLLEQQCIEAIYPLMVVASMHGWTFPCLYRLRHALKNVSFDFACSRGDRQGFLLTFVRSGLVCCWHSMAVLPETPEGNINVIDCTAWRLFSILFS